MIDKAFRSMVVPIDDDDDDNHDGKGNNNNNNNNNNTDPLGSSLLRGQTS
jgi:hypothetical protein